MNSADIPHNMLRSRYK